MVIRNSGIIVIIIRWTMVIRNIWTIIIRNNWTLVKVIINDFNKEPPLHFEETEG